MIDKIAANFYCITLPMPFRLKHVHIYALVHNKEVALFDTGLNIGNAYVILENDLESIGQSIEAVRDIYITHAHLDHHGMAGIIKKKSGATIHLSAVADASNQNSLKPDLVARQMKKFYLAHGLTAPEVDGLIMVFNSMPDLVTAFQGDDFLPPQAVRKFGDWQFEALFTPGHSSGHMCYYFQREGFLLSGDTVLPEITPNLSPDMFDENFRPLHSFLKSLKELENLPVKKVYPCHGPAFDDLRARVRELNLHHEERTQLILNCLNSKPKNTFEVAQEIFGRNLPDFDKFLALNETYVHLLELKLQGIIQEKQAGNNLVYTCKLDPNLSRKASPRG